jgi:hypothetical protein
VEILSFSGNAAAVAMTALGLTASRKAASPGGSVPRRTLDQNVAGKLVRDIFQQPLLGVKTRI